jgi:hemolysin D
VTAGCRERQIAKFIQNVSIHHAALLCEIPGTPQHLLAFQLVDQVNRRLIYATRVKLDAYTLNVGNQSVRLTPCMEVTGEVKTGTRQVIEYFLSPLIQYSHESLRER